MHDWRTFVCHRAVERIERAIRSIATAAAGRRRVAPIGAITRYLLAEQSFVSPAERCNAVEALHEAIRRTVTQSEGMRYVTASSP